MAKKPGISRRLLQDLQWLAKKPSQFERLRELTITPKDAKALLAALGAPVPKAPSKNP